MKRAILIVAAIGLSVLGLAQPQPRRDFVLTEQHAIGVFPPEPVSDGVAKAAKWAGSGRYLLIDRYNPKFTPELMSYAIQGGRVERDPGERQLLLWSAKTRVSKQVWTAKSATSRIDDLEWMTGADVAFAMVSTWQPDVEERIETMSVLMIQPGSGQIRTIAQSAPDEPVSLILSPTQPTGLLMSHEAGGDRTIKIQMLSSTGLASNPMSVRIERFGGIMWGSDGRTVYLGQRQPRAEGQRGQVMWSRLNPTSGALTPVEKPDLYSVGQEVVPEILPSDGRQAIVKEAVSVNVTTLWLSSGFKSEFQHVLLATEVSDVEMSPAGDAVYYVSQGVGYVRPLIRIAKDKFVQMLTAADRATVISNTKQAVTALLMYSLDNDDRYPMKEADIVALLHPYTKDAGVLKGFVYTFSGGDMRSIENPATTEVGYSEGPGGRAVAYADGHVVWKPQT